MSEYAANLGRAARLIKRLADINGPNEFEGVLLKEIVSDLLVAQNNAYAAEAAKRIGVFRCEPDESAGLAEVVELHGYSQKVSTPKEVPA